MALFKIEKGLAANLETNRPYAKEGYAYFTTDDGKLYIDIQGDGTTPARTGKDRICLNAANADTADYATKAKYNEAGFMPNSVSYSNESNDGVKIGTLNIDDNLYEILYPAPIRISYVASEGQSEFDIPFDFPSANSLTVYHNGVLLEMNKHYTVNEDDKKITLNEYGCLSGDDFTIMGISGSANISTGIQYLDDTRILFTDRKNVMLENSGIMMNPTYAPNNDYDVTTKKYVDGLYDQGPMKLYAAQPITIGNTTKDFDGSSGVSWTLAEIGAAAAIHTHDYLPLAGGTLTGDLNVPDNNITAKRFIGYLQGTAEYANELANARAFTIGESTKTFSGADEIFWTLKEIGVEDNYLKLIGGTLIGELILNDDPTKPLQASTKQYVDNNLTKYLPLTGGELTGNLKAPKFVGDLLGAAEYASKLENVRTLTIGDSSKSFDGSESVSWTLSEIGAAATSHTHSYLPLSGGTLTGNLQLARDPTTNLQAATKQYVDNHVPDLSGYLPLSGGTLTGNLTAPTFIGNLSGNASSATNADTVDGYHASSFGLSGMAPSTDYNKITSSGFYRVNASYTNSPGKDWGQLIVCHGGGDTITQIYGDYSSGTLYTRSGNPTDVGGSGSWTSWYQIWKNGDSVTGAVWNDYAEYRESDTKEFGYVLSENGDDTLSKSIKRLQSFAGVSSDTWGFSQGETEKAKTPIAVAGRVLVYPYQNRNNYKPGDCVCSAPGGKVDIMTREEVIQWPDRIVGIVSCVPNYEEWGGGELADRDPVKVNGRIWIKIL